MLQLTRSVTAGSPIIVEKPLIVVDCPATKNFAGRDVADPSFFRSAYQSLSCAQRSWLQNFAQNHKHTDHPVMHVLTPEEDHFRRVLQVNAHSYGAGRKMALFEFISMCQHACDDNAQYCSIEAFGVGRVIASRDLSAGELVKICYLPSSGPLRMWPRWVRRAELETKFHFTCTCDLCGTEAVDPGSARSLALSRSYDKLDAAFCQGDRFFKLARTLVSVCEAAAAEDDALFHLFRTHLLVYDFHINYFCQSAEGDEHLIPALEHLSEWFSLFPEGESVLPGAGKLSFIFTAGLRALLKDRAGKSAKWLRALQHLWVRLGRVVRDGWSDLDPDYRELCRVFGEPDGRLRAVTEVAAELRSVRPCALCGTASILKCSRCNAEMYCSVECQRARWASHKKACTTTCDSRQRTV